MAAQNLTRISSKALSTRFKAQSSHQPFRLFDLPNELRFMIYDACDAEALRGISITCRQIRHETKDRCNDRLLFQINWNTYFFYPYECAYLMMRRISWEAREQICDNYSCRGAIDGNRVSHLKPMDMHRAWTVHHLVLGETEQCSASIHDTNVKPPNREDDSVQYIVETSLASHFPELRTISMNTGNLGWVQYKVIFPDIENRPCVKIEPLRNLQYSTDIKPYTISIPQLTGTNHLLWKYHVHAVRMRELSLSMDNLISLKNTCESDQNGELGVVLQAAQDSRMEIMAICSQPQTRQQLVDSWRGVLQFVECYYMRDTPYDLYEFPCETPTVDGVLDLIKNGFAFFEATREKV